jgi:hypothetical protein
MYGFSNIDELLKYADEYKGQHQAPGNEDSPLYDVTLNETYPKDIYSSDSARLYGDGFDTDGQAISIIHYYRNKPNASVKIYRAVPDLNFEIDKKIKELNAALSYKTRYGFFPMSDKKGFEYFRIIQNICFEQYQNNDSGMTHEDYHKLITDTCENEINTLKSQRSEKIPLNSGDWVTTVKKYADDHGKRELKNNYKILSKTVLANQLFTDGNSIHEWGYIG